MAPRPSLPVEGARAGAGLLAHVLVQKYADHLPLERQEKIFSRHGVSIAKSTMVGWIAGFAEMLAPVVAAMKESVLASKYVLCDETTVPVLDKEKPGKSHTGYLWGYGDGTSAVVFDYQKSRSRAGPESFLSGFQGYLHSSDGYAAYDAIGKREGVAHLGCWAHARRKFFELSESEPWAAEAVEKIRALYQVEREAKERHLAHENIAALRKERSAPMLAELHAWLMERRERLLPASGLRGAFEYTLGQWDRLTRYVEDGRLHIDNNFSERCIRPLVIGRKNWLFAGSHEGAKRAAVVYSLIGSCRLLGIEPFAYLRDVLTRVADYPAKRIADLTMDWTDFDRDGHATVVLSLVTGHGRGTPLIWTTVKKEALKDHRNFHEDAVLHRLREIVPQDLRVTVLADRGFGDTELYRFVEEDLGFDYIIRFRENILVTSKQGEEREAFLWVPESGRAKTLDEVLLTGKRKPVPRVVAVRKRAMKDAWCLATSRVDLKADEIIELYGKRWGIETVFRDIKDYRFGMGMKKVRTESTDRRDRLFLISALAIALLTLLGAAGEAVGLERTIKANTVKTRSYSLWRQGCIYYALLPGMKSDRATLLINKFHDLMSQHRIFKKVFGIL